MAKRRPPPSPAQVDLFGPPSPPPRKPRKPRPRPPEGTQAAEIRRVHGRIGPSVLRFLRGRIAASMLVFYANDLRTFVVEEIGVAPSSPDRILRALRQQGIIAYEVLNRRASEYRVIRVNPPGPDEEKR